MQKCQLKILDKRSIMLYDTIVLRDVLQDRKDIRNVLTANHQSYAAGCGIRSEDMEMIVRKTLLYDFYGELLTDHQKSVYSDYILNDIGISEIAGERGITRQGVHELVRRCDRILEEYEEKLHLAEKFLNAKKMVAEINTLAENYKKLRDEHLIDEIKEITNRILEEF